ncbi:MAG: amino acid permease [Gemmatimonadetes bacterium]|nr:amino acid permease [Gemmatimonadota bacterium]HNV74846.1 amino acid permease [Gemmatimonadaceae bacterium]MBK6457532.1 amino acid permease [Gemmatimonadota bacterium]MBK6842744.1 amino acid permease [Gemmatimonadota bacterium]MBK8059364.1 amino acid permease [Gemmatimonadota bacterium]
MAGTPSLQRGLGLLEATTLIVGGTIGVSIFLVPAGVAREVGSPGLALFTWLFTGFMALCGALSFAELASAMPETGGTYVFLKRAYPATPLAFLFAWMMLFAQGTGNIAVVASMASLYAGHFAGGLIPADSFAQRAVAVAIIALLTAVNAVGLRTSGRVQNVLTGLKVLMMTAIVVACLTSPAGDVSRLGPFLPQGRGGGEIAGSVATAMILSVFSYSGFYFVTHVAGEVRDPGRTLSRAIMIAMAVVLATYLLLNVAFVYVLPFAELQGSPRVAADAMARAVGPRAADVTALVVLLSALGTLNAQLLNYPRITYALASDGLFFKAISRVHASRHVPVGAIVLVGTWASILALAGSYTQILGWAAFVNQAFMALTVIGLFILRRIAPKMPRPYQVFGYPFTPLLYVAILLWYLTTLLTTRGPQVLIGIGIVAAGLPFYWYWRRASASSTPTAEA